MICGALALTLLASCTSHSTVVVQTVTPVSPSTATAATSTAAASPSSSAPTAPAAPAALSRPAFVARANAMCVAEEAQLKAASGKLTALAAVPAFVDQTTAVLEKARHDFTVLADPQPDRAALQARWLAPRFADYTAQEKEMVVLRAAAVRNDLAGAQQAISAIGNMPNHDATVNPFLTSYGLTACR